MDLFQHDHRQGSATQRRIYARYELAHTAIDFGAAFCFVVGSVMFFYEAWQIPGTWLFLIGSILFAAKPTIRMVREIQLYRLGDYEDLAKREQ